MGTFKDERLHFNPRGHCFRLRSRINLHRHFSVCDDVDGCLTDMLVAWFKITGGVSWALKHSCDIPLALYYTVLR